MPDPIVDREKHLEALESAVSEAEATCAEGEASVAWAAPHTPQHLVAMRPKMLVGFHPLGHPGQA
ncbi:MAG TPA: hypothetical protein VGB13_03365, partial [Candidatus Krumholzibacteria bacterium]